MKIGIVGCGLIGTRRAQIAHQFACDEVVIVADVDEARANILATEMNCLSTIDWHEVVNNPELDIVVVATPNKYIMPVTVAALNNGKHVLCEKPPGRNFNETIQMVSAAKNSSKILKIGFNHRHHPAIMQAHELCCHGEIGPLLFIRAIYGHGGRPGYDKEWRGIADLSGGGELLDQGVHVVDLCRWFLGDFSQAFGVLNTYYWDLGYFENEAHRLSVGDASSVVPGAAISPLTQRYAPASSLEPISQMEDNAFVILRTLSGQVAQFHTSWTQWKNKFSFEIVGRDGYLRIDGLGGSYGVETLTLGHRRQESGPPIENHFEYSGPDLSWRSEWQEFSAAILEGRQPLGNGDDGLGAMLTIAAVYESANKGRFIQL